MIVPSKPKISDPITGSRQPEYFTEPVTSSTFNNDSVEFYLGVTIVCACTVVGGGLRSGVGCVLLTTGSE